MAAAPSRRWLRFSLRALLVAITIFCCWLGWQRSIVSERQRLREQYHQPGTALRDVYFFTARDYETLPPDPFGASMPPPARVSLIRTWLGDEAVQSVILSTVAIPSDQMSQLKRAFPEANFSYSIPDTVVD